MAITCFVRDPIDPWRHDALEGPAGAWSRIARRGGGEPIGLVMPHAGGTGVAWAEALSAPRNDARKVTP